LGGPPGAAEVERAPRAQTHMADTRSTIGWEPPGAAHVHKARRAQKHTRPKAGARLAGGPRLPPRSTGLRDRKNNIRRQEQDWPGAPPGGRPNPRGPANAKSTQRKLGARSVGVPGSLPRPQEHPSAKAHSRGPPAGTYSGQGSGAQNSGPDSGPQYGPKWRGPDGRDRVMWSQIRGPFLGT